MYKYMRVRDCYRQLQERTSRSWWSSWSTWSQGSLWTSWTIRKTR